MFPVEVPPLRERIEDVVPLALSFLELTCQELNREPIALSQSQIVMLKQHSWPGNIRELKNTIERAVISSHGSKLKLEITQMGMLDTESEHITPAQLPVSGYLTSEEFKALERKNITAALAHANWKTWGDGGAAALLGVKPSTLAYQMKTLGIKKPDPQSD